MIRLLRVSAMGCTGGSVINALVVTRWPRALPHSLHLRAWLWLMVVDAAGVQEFVNKMYFITCAIFFGVLVLLAGFYIQQLRTARRSTAGTSRQEVVVTSFIFVIFLSRCVWDFLAAFDSSSSLFRQGLWETTGKHVKLMNVETFFLLFIWLGHSRIRTRIRTRATAQ